MFYFHFADSQIKEIKARAPKIATTHKAIVKVIKAVLNVKIETRKQAVLIYFSEDDILSLGGTPSLEQAQWLVIPFYKDMSEY